MAGNLGHMAVDCDYGRSVKTRASASPVVARQYETGRGERAEAVAEAAVHEDGTITLRVVVYE